jgi:CDP-diacylglycerol pyrophosphatase
MCFVAACRLPANSGSDRPPEPTRNPNALWEIVSTCTAGRPGDYCACPALVRSCCGEPGTPDADVVWARERDYVAIRDLGMCGCAPGFVHGLALPRARITGIEDPQRPAGIWSFAWRVARSHIVDEMEIALVINPADARSQNQMHIHLLRLKPAARTLLDGAPPGALADGARLIDLPNLDTVFQTTVAQVGETRMRDTGILVTRGRNGGYRAVVTERTSPQAYTVNRCRDAQG